MSDDNASFIPVPSGGNELIESIYLGKLQPDEGNDTDVQRRVKEILFGPLNEHGRPVSLEGVPEDEVQDRLREMISLTMMDPEKAAEVKALGVQAIGDSRSHATELATLLVVGENGQETAKRAVEIIGQGGPAEACSLVMSLLELSDFVFTTMSASVLVDPRTGEYEAEEDDPATLQDAQAIMWRMLMTSYASYRMWQEEGKCVCGNCKPDDDEEGA